MNQSQYEALTIQDDFMFKKVMQCKRICMRLISEIMQVEVRGYNLSGNGKDC